MRQVRERKSPRSAGTGSSPGRRLGASDGHGSRFPLGARESQTEHPDRVTRRLSTVATPGTADRERPLKVALVLSGAYLGMGQTQRCLTLGRQMLPLAEQLNDA